jgi:hypothetical protein
MNEEMTVAKRQQMDAIRMLSDWSKFLITIETGGIGGIVALIGLKAPHLTTQADSGSGYWSHVVAAVLLLFLCVAAPCFLYSIINACNLLWALPGIVENLHKSKEATLYDMNDPGFDEPAIFTYAKRQYLSFRTGLIVFVAMLIIWGVRLLF